ncbi:hypothetical protein K493DRAFT_319375 [Basidiobolus meristosporus CBS 931.73]|uniref:Uncharacterized protein n=1 Tax=Basidiobolus meristosporus CBS 931.73 TaxID=1314790 RepID=A0A1Y1XS13_9FUNG|nr:hypothetical protein K493DRAFT_319375 [Basidiobolus meristosporus CBS 931.73]|eukprot:ORX88551.1 hypothetical protein K493DRAFT_319375 [Basidiobolus meristosporus CBS 931.73]
MHKSKKVRVPEGPSVDLSHSIRPKVPQPVQSSLMCGPMRVRKAVSEGYKHTNIMANPLNAHPTQQSPNKVMEVSSGQTHGIKHKASHQTLLTKYFEADYMDI